MCYNQILILLRLTVRQVSCDNQTLFLSAAMLDIRLKALDFLVRRRFPEETLMAKQELYPRRFQRNQKLQRRWKAAQDVLVLQEILVRLRAARERRESERVRVCCLH